VDGFAFSYQGLTFGILHRNSASGVLVNTFIPQSSWNVDKADGTQTLPAIDFTLGNVFEITIQWLGFGAVVFSIENPSTGRFTIVHRLEYANTYGFPSLSNPTLPISMGIDNGATSNVMKMCTSSIGVFTEGIITRTPIVNSFQYTQTNAGATPIILLALRNTGGNFGPQHANHIEAFLQYCTFAMSSSGNRTYTIQILLNQPVSNPAWTAVDSLSSVLERDTVGVLDLVTSPQGTVLFSATIANNTSQAVDLTVLNLDFEPGETIHVIGFTNTGTGDVSVSLNVLEDH
jgi:hypothetical protein